MLTHSPFLLMNRQTDGPMVLEAFLCPLTKKVFTDPVVCLGDGVTYERSAIEGILNPAKLSNKPTVLSPVTNRVIDVWAGCLVPNRALKDAILTVGPEGKSILFDVVGDVAMVEAWNSESVFKL